MQYDYFFFQFTYNIEYIMVFFFFFQAEDGIRDLVRSRGLGDVYKRQSLNRREQGFGKLSPTQHSAALKER